MGTAPELPYSGTTNVTLGVSYAEEFTKAGYHYECPTKAGGDPFESEQSEVPVSPSSNVAGGGVTWTVSLILEDVVTGSGTDECYGGDVSLYVRVSTDGTVWSEPSSRDATIGDPPSNLHPAPTLSNPSSTSISYNATSSVSMTVTSTTVFTAWEYKHVCWEADGDRYISAVGNTWPANPTPSGLNETAWWTVRTGGEDNQCFSRPNAAQVWLYVRVKSASTSWSDWVYHPLSIDLSPVAPTFTQVSHNATNEVEYGKTVKVSATVNQKSGFTRVQQYVSCQNRDGGKVELWGTDDGKSPVFTSTTSLTRDWDVTTGDASGECSDDAQPALFARVLTSSGWSRWGSVLVPIAAPVCAVDVPVDAETDQLDRWFVDCTDLHRNEGEFNARRYRITLPNSTEYFPVAIDVTSSIDFEITLVGGSSSALVDSQGGLTRGAGLGAVWYSGRMVKALGVTHTAYVIEISTTETNTTGTFTIDIEPFELVAPTDLKANGHSTGTNGQSRVTWDSVDHATGYEIKYECTPPCVGSTWSRTSTNKATLSLRLNTLYTINVRSNLGNYASDESDDVYTYSTKTIPLNRNVASIALTAYWNPPEYQYIFCTDTIPTTAFSWETEVREGMARWNTATDGIVTLRHTARECDGDDDNDTFDSHEQTGNQVWFASPSEVGAACGLAAAAGCAQGGKTSSGERTPTRIMISDDLTSNRCGGKGVFQVAGHEAGHAFGLGHSAVSPALMEGAIRSGVCEPQPYDIVAIKALYQSVPREE